MPIKDALLPEYDHEIATTRKLLERLPASNLGWKPHARSMSLGRLATHIAEVPGWGGLTLGGTEYNMEPGAYTPVTKDTPAEILALFEENARTMRTRLEAASDGELLVPWTLKNAGTPVFSMPRIGVLRSMVMNHLIHHRGQLSVYLRQNDVPLPPMYGPTADERA